MLIFFRNKEPIRFRAFLVSEFPVEKFGKLEKNLYLNIWKFSPLKGLSVDVSNKIFHSSRESYKIIFFYFFYFIMFQIKKKIDFYENKLLTLKYIWRASGWKGGGWVDFAVKRRVWRGWVWRGRRVVGGCGVEND